MRGLKHVDRQRYKEKENAKYSTFKESSEAIDGWRHESINALTEKIDRLNVLSSRDQKLPPRNKSLRNKEILCTDHQVSGIHHLKLQALRLDSEDFDITINKREVRRATEPKSKSMESNKQHLEGLFRLTKNGIITQAFELKKQRALKKRSLAKGNFKEKGEGSVKKVRDTLMRDWEDAKKCISSVSSTKSSHKTYLNYSQRIKNSTLYRNRVMRVVFDDPVYPPGRASLSTVPQTNKLDLINAILRERFPQIF